MHSGGLLTKLTYTKLEDNLIRHRGDRRAPRSHPLFPLSVSDIGANHGFSVLCFVRVFLFFTSFGTFRVYDNFVVSVMEPLGLL